jgi:hypothetical protein
MTGLIVAMDNFVADSPYDFPLILPDTAKDVCCPEQSRVLLVAY